MLSEIIGIFSLSAQASQVSMFLIIPGIQTNDNRVLVYLQDSHIKSAAFCRCFCDTLINGSNMSFALPLSCRHCVVTCHLPAMDRHLLPKTTRRLPPF